MSSLPDPHPDSVREDDSHQKVEEFLVQWNCNGFYAHHEEFQKISRELQPTIFCIQETLTSEGNELKLRGYRSFLRSDKRGPSGRVKGGVGILVKEDCPSEQLTISDKFQMMAVRVRYPKSITICNIYLPPGQDVDINNLVTEINNLPKPRLICTDANARHESWGSSEDDRRGREIAKLLMEELDMMVFNDGSHTHFSAAYGSFSAIDITFGDPELNLLFDWRVDLYHSDHYPIVMGLLESRPINVNPGRWILKNVNWQNYSAAIESELTQKGQLANVDDFVELVQHVAGTIFDKSKGSSKKVPVPWWCEDCKIAVRDRKRARRRYKRHPNDETLADFRRARARARFIIRKANRDSWLEDRRKLKIISLGLRITSVPTHLLRHRILANQSFPTNSFLKKIHENCETNGVDLKLIRTESSSKVPPWLIQTNIDTSLTKWKKHEATPAVFQFGFRELKSEYPGFQLVFTDGSKTDEGTGALFVTENTCCGYFLPLDASVFDAEAYAILKALEHCISVPRCFFLVCTDSLSVLQSLKDMYTRDKRITAVRDQLMKCQVNDKDIVFAWVPGHVGIAGNELADKTTKTATTEVSEFYIKHNRTNIQAKCKRGMFANNTKKWNESDNKLCKIKKKVWTGGQAQMALPEEVK